MYPLNFHIDTQKIAIFEAGDKFFRPIIFGGLC